MDHDEQYRFIYAFCYKVVSYTDADVHGFASVSQQQHLACACQYAICWLKFLYKSTWFTVDNTLQMELLFGDLVTDRQNSPVAVIDSILDVIVPAVFCLACYC